MCLLWPLQQGATCQKTHLAVVWKRGGIRAEEEEGEEEEEEEDKKEEKKNRLHIT